MNTNQQTAILGGHLEGWRDHRGSDNSDDDYKLEEGESIRVASLYDRHCRNRKG